MKRFLLSLVTLIFLSCSAQAATCYWVGGSGNFDNTNTASWSSATGGSAGTCAATGGIPKNAADFAIFDANSGSPTVTVCGASSANCPSGAGSVNISGITFGACTCTLDFGTNNPSVTLSTTFSGTGTATRSLNMGTGTWTFGGGSGATWNFTNTSGFTPTSLTAPITWTGASTATSFFGGGQSWGALTISANVTTPTSRYRIEPGNSANNTFASLTVNAPALVELNAGTTQTFTGGLTVSGSSFSAMVTFITNGVSSSGSTMAVGAVSNVSYTAWLGITGATSAINATNSLNLTPGFAPGTLSITPPSGGSGGRIIGG